MELYTGDRNLNATLEHLFEHSAPFHVSELETLTGPLKLQGVKDVSFITYCTNLQHLEISASDIEDLNFLTNLKKLNILKIMFSPLQDIQAIVNCKALEYVELFFTLVENMHPLLELPKLQRGVLLGNPWTYEGYYTLRPKLLHTPSKYWQSPPVLQFSEAESWQVTRQLWEKNLHLCFAAIDGDRSVLVKPGISTFYPDRMCNFVPADAGSIGLDLQEVSDWTTSTLFEAYKPERKDLYFDFQRHWTIGNNHDAKEWVRDSSLPSQTKEDLLTFIARFPTLTFYQEDETMLERFDELVGIKMPEWLKRIRQTFAFVLPAYFVTVQFDTTDHHSAIEDSLDNTWYRLDMVGYNSPEEQDVFDRVDEMRLFPIGEAWPQQQSTLAINLSNQQDQHVYEYSIEDIFDDIFMSSLAGLAGSSVFSSYTRMLAHIIAIQAHNGQETWIVKAIE